MRKPPADRIGDDPGRDTVHRRDGGERGAPDRDRDRELSGDSTIHVLRLAQGGDGSAARELVERALPRLRRWSRGRLPRYARGGADTEDIVHDVVVRTLKRIDKIDHRSVGAMQAYLREAVVNRIRDLIRGASRRGAVTEATDDLAGDDRSPLELAIMRERSQRFLEALQRLKPADRQILVWRIELGYSVDEIARRLGKTKAAAGMSVTRAVARLGSEMAV